MAVKPSRIMADRMREMLTRDKMGVHEGFMSAFANDLARVIGDYFDPLAPPAVSVRRNDDGEFEVLISARASGIKRFETTGDLPKPEC